MKLLPQLEEYVKRKEKVSLVSVWHNNGSNVSTLENICRVLVENPQKSTCTQSEELGPARKWWTYNIFGKIIVPLDHFYRSSNAANDHLIHLRISRDHWQLSDWPRPVTITSLPCDVITRGKLALRRRKTAARALAYRGSQHECYV